jgi:outer membrane protein OmpA-like peptidoglycan-associated protein
MKKHVFLYFLLLPIKPLLGQTAPNFVDKPVWQFTLLFDVGKAAIQPQFHSKLDSLAVGMAHDTSFQVRIKAHTDASGSDALNEKLSKSRAETLKNYLSTRGIDDNRLETAWKGEFEPISDNDTEGGKMQNRRVTVEVFRRIYLAKMTSTVKSDSGVAVPNALVMVRSQYLTDSTRTDSLGVFSINVPYKQPAIVEVTAKDHFYDKKTLNLGVLSVKVKDFIIAKAEIGKKLKIKDLNFYGDEARLLPESEPNLKIILFFLRLNPSYKIELAGHINGEQKLEPINSFGYNLSVARAKMVYNYLVFNGIDPNRLTYKGYANWEMIFINAYTPEGEKANRRVEIRILEK